MTKKINLDETILSAYLDEELALDQREAVRTALAQDPEAQALLGQLRQDRQFVTQTLTQIAPAGHTQSAAPQALRRLKSELAASNVAPPISFFERITLMTQKNFFKRYQPAIITVALIALLAATFSFAPVRALAGEFLNIFRVQQVVVVPVNPDQLQNLEGNTELETMFNQVADQVEVLLDGGDPYEVASLAEAQATVDFTLATLPNMAAPDEIGVEPKRVAQFLVDKDLADAVFEAAQIEVTLPDSLNDTPIVIHKPDIVAQIWGEGEHPSLAFMQMRSPEIEYPDDLDLNALGVAGLQLLGYSKAEAVALGATIDWANTLILPLPTDADVEVEQISVNGASGQLMTEPDGKHAALVWQKDGITYFLGSEDMYYGDGLLVLAESID